MKRLILAAVAAAALSAPAMAANCAKDYKDFWENFDREKYAKMSAEQIADLSRTALRGYDACTAGDERFTADNFFKKLDSRTRTQRRRTSSRTALSDRPVRPTPRSKRRLTVGVLCGRRQSRRPQIWRSLS